jgi:hypothetical protein
MWEVSLQNLPLTRASLLSIRTFGSRARLAYQISIKTIATSPLV